MSPDDTVNAYILETQIAIFEDARHDLQLTIAEIARQARLPVQTVNAWAQGRNGLTLWGVKKLARVKKLIPLLSRLFEPEECALVPVEGDDDHAAHAGHCVEFLADYAAARHPESECAEKIGPNEDRKLKARRAVA
jgi:hypothetical protein